MRSTIVKSFIIVSLIFSLLQSLYSEPDKCGRIAADTITKHIPVSEFNIISTREVQGLCEIILSVNGRIIPLYGNENGLVSGDLYFNKQNVTKEKVYEINKRSFIENKKELDEAVAFEYIPAEVKSQKILYMFTEPFCPYCHKAGSEVKNLADKYGVKVRILLVSMKGEEGKKKCVEAACRHFKLKEKFGFAEYNQLEWKKEKPADEFICREGEELINKTEELSNKMYIDGIPLFYLDNGEYVSGADIEALELLMSSK